MRPATFGQNLSPINLSSSSNALLTEVDWNFHDLNNEGINSLHWYPATFLSAIPGTIVPLLTRPGDVVLDPFCGTCTTGIEATRLGRRFYGIDANPIATLIGKAKLLLPTERSLLSSLEPETLLSIFQTFDSSVAHPNETTLLRWYHPSTYRELLFLLYRISSIRSYNARLVAQSLFSSILKNVSSQSRHWGWVCDNVTPPADEIVYKDAIAAFVDALNAYLTSVSLLLQDMAARGTIPARRQLRSLWHIRCGDANTVLKAFARQSVDLILTSPPYYGVADYVKSQRLSFLWFGADSIRVEGFSTGDFEALRRREVGSRSYRHSSDSFARYLTYMQLFLIQAVGVLKPNGHIAILLGESDARERTADLLELAATSSGLVKTFATVRSIKKTRRRLMAKVKTERLLIFQAPT